MLTSLFWTLAGMIVTGGGVYVAAMFVPSVALVAKGVLDFARSPLGMIAAVIVAGFLLFSSGYVSGDIHGTNETRAAWRADNAARAAEAKRLLAENKLNAAADANARIAEIDGYAANLKRKVDDYEAQNAGRAMCRLTADDVRRLRALAR